MNNIMEELLQRYPTLEACGSDIQAAYELMCTCYEREGTVYVCGNGGSAADAEHIVGELMKSFLLPRPIAAETAEKISDSSISDRLEGALRAVALTSPVGLTTAFANDVGAELVFAQQVYGYARPGEVLWALSTSGNSKNVLAALRVAKAMGCLTLGLTGQGGGTMVDLCDVCICVPEEAVYKVQELHLPIYHALCRMLEVKFFG